MGLVVADTVEWPLLMDITSDFVYCRLHGSEQLYASGYEADALQVWARRVVAWLRGEEVTDGRRASKRDAPKRKRRDVFVYFDNDMKVRAPFDAEGSFATNDQAACPCALRRLFDQPVSRPRSLRKLAEILPGYIQSLHGEISGPGSAVLFRGRENLSRVVRTGLGLMGVGFAVSRFGLFLRELSANQTHLPAKTTGLSLWSG